MDGTHCSCHGGSRPGCGCAETVPFDPCVWLFPTLRGVFPRACSAVFYQHSREPLQITGVFRNHSLPLLGQELKGPGFPNSQLRHISWRPGRPHLLPAPQPDLSRQGAGWLTHLARFLLRITPGSCLMFNSLKSIMYRLFHSLVISVGGLSLVSICLSWLQGEFPRMPFINATGRLCCSSK